MNKEELEKASKEVFAKMDDYLDNHFPQWQESDGGVTGEDKNYEDKQDAFWQGAKWFKNELQKIIKTKL